MFKVIDLLPEGKPEESLDVARVAPPPDGVIRWIELVDTDRDALALLQQRFGFHDLAIEDCASFELYSKLAEYEDHLFVVLHTFTGKSDDPAEIQIHEIHAFLGERYLVTVHDNPIPAAESVWRRAAASRSVLERGPCWALYHSADAMIDAVFPVLDRIACQLDDAESKLIHGDRDISLGEIVQLRATLAQMRRVVRPMRDVINMLSRREGAPMNARTAWYFRDVYDHVIRCAETIDEAQALVSNVVDAYQSSVSSRTNEIMAKLTVFSAIFLPLGFITGFWGQNFDSLPIGENVWFYVSLAITLALPITLLVYFGRKGWL